MRLLVIGGSGFIGPCLVAELRRGGHEVAVFHRGRRGAKLPPDVRGILGDRRDLAAHAGRLRDFAPDVVLDMILSSGAQAQALMDTFRGFARRVVALSSMDVYRACGVLHGFEPGPLETLPLREDSPLRTRTQVYPPERIRMLQQRFGWLDDAYDKIPVERAVLGHQDLPGTVLRLPMTYGVGDPLHRFFPMLKRMEDGRRVILFEETVARWRSPRGFAENVAGAIALAATSERAVGRVYNVGERDSFSELEWARKIAAAVGWQGEFVELPRERAPAHLVLPGNLEQHWVADTSRIRQELGYREAVAREEAILRTIAWERAHPPQPIDARPFDYAAEDAALRET